MSWGLRVTPRPRFDLVELVARPSGGRAKRVVMTWQEAQLLRDELDRALHDRFDTTSPFADRDLPVPEQLPELRAGYGSWEWRQASKRYLAAHPNCERVTNGIVCGKEAYEVNHRDGRAPDEPGANRWENLESVCRFCHRQDRAA